MKIHAQASTYLAPTTPAPGLHAILISALPDCCITGPKECQDSSLELEENELSWGLLRHATQVMSILDAYQFLT